MMEENKKEKELRSILLNIGQEKPSPKFLDNVMKAVVSLPEVTTVKPLLNTKAWFFVGVCLLAVIIGLFVATPLNIPMLPEAWQLPKITTPSYSFNWNLNLGSTLVYSIAILAIFFGIQVKLLAKFVNKPIEIPAT